MVGNPASILLQIVRKLKKMVMTSQLPDMISSSFFWHFFISLVKFSYWYKFHVSMITGSGVMTIYFYKGLTRNPEIGNTPVWVLHNIWRLKRVRNTKFWTSLIRLYWMLQNDKVVPFIVSELFKKTNRGGWGIKLPPPPPPPLYKTR